MVTDEIYINGKQENRLELRPRELYFNGGLVTYDGVFLDWPLTISLALRRGYGTPTFIRNTPATYYDVNGDQQEALANVPGYGVGGILLSPESTNICLQSNDLTTTWTPVGVVPTATTITENAVAATQHRLLQGATVTDGISYTLQAKVKRLVGTRDFALQGNFGARVYFDLTAGTVANEVSGAGTIVDLGSGEYLCTVSGVAVGTSVSFYTSICDGTTTGSETYDGNGTSSLQLTDVQFEQSDFATNFVATTTVPVTRDKTELSLQVTGNLPLAGARHIKFDVTPKGVDSGTAQCLWATRSDATNYVAIWLDGVDIWIEKIIAGASEVASLTVAASVGTTYQVDAFINADNTLNLYVDSVVDDTNTSTTAAPVYGTTMEYGSLAGVSNAFCNFANHTITNSLVVV